MYSADPRGKCVGSEAPMIVSCQLLTLLVSVVVCVRVNALIGLLLGVVVTSSSLR